MDGVQGRGERAGECVSAEGASQEHGHVEKRSRAWGCKCTGQVQAGLGLSLWRVVSGAPGASCRVVYTGALDWPQRTNVA